LVEALACKIPIVAADCHSGPREVLAPGTELDNKITKAELATFGILMPVLNDTVATQEWVVTLKHVVLNETLRNEYASKGLVRLKDFSVSAILEQWMSLIERNTSLR
jgi:glycosyltransferase involved in cell wall biosynthesis